MLFLFNSPSWLQPCKLTHTQRNSAYCVSTFMDPKVRRRQAFICRHLQATSVHYLHAFNAERSNRTTPKVFPYCLHNSNYKSWKWRVGTMKFLVSWSFFFLHRQTHTNLMHSAWRRCYQCNYWRDYQCNHWRDVWIGPGNETRGRSRTGNISCLLALVIINPLK